MAGKLIVLEGVDGSGKETQTKLLIERMERCGKHVKTMSFPRYEEEWGKKIKSYLAGEFGNLKSLDPLIPSLLYSMDRKEAIPRLIYWIESEFYIVLDRYMESNLGYQGAKLKGEERSELIKKLKHLEYEILGIPKSDMVIYLDLPVEESVKAINQRNEKEILAGRPVKDIHQDNIDYLSAVRETYRELALTGENWVTINCFSDGNRLSKEEVSNLVWQAFSQRYL